MTIDTGFILTSINLCISLNVTVARESAARGSAWWTTFGNTDSKDFKQTAGMGLILEPDKNDSKRKSCFILVYFNFITEYNEFTAISRI